MIDPDPAAAPLSGLLVYVSSALSTPHLVYILAQTPSPGSRKLQLQPSSNLRPSASRRKVHFPWVPPGCLTSCMRRAAVQTRSCTLASHLPTFKVGGWGDDAGSSISRASVKFKAERGLGTARARSEVGDLFVYRVMSALWSHLTTDQRSGPELRGSWPQQEAVYPQMLYSNLRAKGGRFGIDFHRSVVCEPSWLEGAELFGPPEL